MLAWKAPTKMHICRILTACLCTSTNRAPARLGVSFSPAGLLTPFHLGASSQLQRLGLITPDTALAGASGGALAALTTALQVSNTPPQSANPLQASVDIAIQCRNHGARSVLYSALTQTLQETLPEDVAELLNQRPTPCTIAYTTIGRGLQGQFVDTFHSKEDVIECLLASCNIPFYGNKGHVMARGQPSIDGVFAVKQWRRMGCPHTSATEKEILISPFSLPRQQSAAVQVSAITPALLSSSLWPYGPMDLIQLALDAPKSLKSPSQPASDEEIVEIYGRLHEAGEEAVRRWHQSHREW